MNSHDHISQAIQQHLHDPMKCIEIMDKIKGDFCYDFSSAFPKQQFDIIIDAALAQKNIVAAVKAVQLQVHACYRSSDYQAPQRTLDSLLNIQKIVDVALQENDHRTAYHIKIGQLDAISDRRVFVDLWPGEQRYGTCYEDKNSTKLWMPQSNTAPYFSADENPAAIGRNYYAPELLNAFESQVYKINDIVAVAEENKDFLLASKMLEAQHYFFICSCSKESSQPEERNARIKELKNRGLLEEALSSFDKTDQNYSSSSNSLSYNN